MDATNCKPHLINAASALSPNVPQVRVVPMVPGMRTRKRSSVLSATSTAGSINTAGENDDMDSITDNDSMRPLADYSRRPRSHKRQRRTILDAFNSISLKGPGPAAASNTTTGTTGGSDRVFANNASSLADSNGRNCQAALNGASYNHHQYPQQEQLLSLHNTSNDGQIYANQHQYNDDADSSRAVAEDNEHDGGGYTTSSSLEDEFDEYDGDDNDNDEVAYEDDETATLDEQMLSDKELIQKNVERKVMLELVFGPESTFVPPKDPVDRKLHRLIDHTIKRVARTGLAAVAAPVSQTRAADSMDTTTNPIHGATILPINGLVVQTNELLDDVSLATTTGGYNSTVSSDSGGANTNANHSDMGSIHSLQTDAAAVGKKLRSKKKSIRFLFQRSNSLPDNLFNNHSNAVSSTIDTVTEEMDTTDLV